MRHNPLQPQPELIEKDWFVMCNVQVAVIGPLVYNWPMVVKRAHRANIE